VNVAQKLYFSLLRGKRDAFRRLFLGADGLPTNDGHEFLSEMRRFCFGGKSTVLRGKDGAVDQFASIAAAARQEVYFRILETIDLSERKLVAMERRANQTESADG
jgi:hypothetical protein